MSISTGYRRVVKSEFGKWEVFITPKFLIEINRGSSASHYTEILGEQVSPFAFMQNSSEWDDLNKYWYHVTLSDEDLNTQNLYQIACQSTTHNASTFSSFIPHYFNSHMVHCAIPQMSQFFFNFRQPCIERATHRTGVFGQPTTLSVSPAVQRRHLAWCADRGTDANVTRRHAASAPLFQRAAAAAARQAAITGEC